MQKGTTIVIVILVIIAVAVLAPFLLSRLFGLLGDKLRKPALSGLGETIKKVSVIDLIIARRAQGHLFGANYDPQIANLSATLSTPPPVVTGGGKYNMAFNDSLDF